MHYSDLEIKKVGADKRDISKINRYRLSLDLIQMAVDQAFVL
jgi:hypothetical protein